MENFAQIERLEQRIQESLGRGQFSGDEFSHLASEGLAQFDFSDSIRKWVLSAAHVDQLPRQIYTTGRIGDVALTLSANDRFRIDLYFWRKGQTTIHNHNFHGAYRILAGEAHEVTYQFHKEEEWDESVYRGSLVVLEQSQTVPTAKPIVPGNRYIHVSHHRSPLTVSLCVRTAGGGAPLSEFYFPRLEILSCKQGSRTAKFLETLRLADYLSESELDELIRNGFSKLPLSRLFYILIDELDWWELSERVKNAVTDQIRDRFGENYQLLLNTLVEHRMHLRSRDFEQSNPSPQHSALPSYSAYQ